jgi:hypothetical protein
MSSSPLWLTLEPSIPYTQLVLTLSGVGTLLKARLSPQPSEPGALTSLLEALSSWQGLPLTAVVDADAEDVERHPELWSRLLGEAQESPRIHVEWSSPPQAFARRDKFFEVGDFRSARRLLTRTVLGER